MTKLLQILSSISSYVFGHLSPEARARKDYPMRAMRDMVDDVLERFPAWGRSGAGEVFVSGQCTDSWLTEKWPR